jgi:hypothetical protein
MNPEKPKINFQTWLYKITVALLILVCFFSLVVYFFNLVPENINNFFDFVVKNGRQVVPSKEVQKTQENIDQINTQGSLSLKCIFTDTQILLQDDKSNCVLESYDLTNVDFASYFDNLKDLPTNKQKLFFYDTNRDIAYIRYLDLTQLFGDKIVSNMNLEADGSWGFSVEENNYLCEPQFQNVRPNLAHPKNVQKNQ